MIFVDTSAFLALVDDKENNNIYDDKKLSFTDCTSFAIMKKRGIEKTFSFDEDIILLRKQIYDSTERVRVRSVSVRIHRRHKFRNR